MEIPDIITRNIQIRKLEIPPVVDVFNRTSLSLPDAPPVTVNIGVPIVDVPGCVEAHEAKNGSKTLPTDDDFDPDQDLSPEEYRLKLECYSDEDLINETLVDEHFTIQQFMETWL